MPAARTRTRTRTRVAKNVNLDINVTELEDIKPTRIDAVGSPASGIPVLFMKSLDGEPEQVKKGSGCGCCDDCECDHDMSKDVNAVGGISETADVNGAEHVLVLLAQLIQSEAREMASGEWDEAYDIQMLIEAASIMRCFRDRESWGEMEDDGDGYVQKAMDDFAKDVYEDFIKASRKFSAETRRSLAAEGKALEDGSYPIPDADALRRAAILARSGHGNVAAAKRLIAKRARELGVPNPLADKNEGKAEKSTAVQADGYGPGAKYEEDKDADDPETDELGDEPEAGNPDGQTVTDDGDDDSDDNVSKAAITEAIAPIENELRLVKEQLAKVLSMPAPGAPAITAPPAARAVQQREELLAKAARADRMSQTVTEPDIRNYFEAEARQARADAAAV